MLKSQRKCVPLSKDVGAGAGRVHTFLLIEVTYKAHGNNGIKFPPFLKLYTFIKVAINVITT